MKFRIRIYHDFPKVCFYTIHVEGRPLSETDDFVTRFKDDPGFRESLQEIQAVLRNMGERYGARIQSFREENKAVALPITTNKLRLYCIWCSPQTVILCNGGQKTSQFVRDSPDAHPHFILANRIAKFLDRLVKESEFAYTTGGKYLLGDLTFDDENDI